jgi:hypothetical protein
MAVETLCLPGDCAVLIEFDPARERLVVSDPDTREPACFIPLVHVASLQ